MSGKIVVLKHVGSEGPGTIADFFANTKWDLSVIDLGRESALLGELTNIDGIVSMGGPMNAYEEELYPFLKDEIAFLKKAVEEEIPTIGICLGAQLLARSCGATVKRAEEEEIGWYDVELTEDGLRDPLFSGIPAKIRVFQWHHDTFEIPAGGTLMAKGRGCLNQAFKVGANAYGLQFHVEVTPQMITSWIRECGELREGAADILFECYEGREALRELTEKLCLNFSRMISVSQRSATGRTPAGHKTF
ncbi:MAG: type 1 glutamine amidotransferase [Candidatus Omnitrophota bacterium]